MKEARGKRIVWICFMVLIAALSVSLAWADFYVVASGKRARKTILVSPKGTETASGTALLNALNGITDASASNPYLIIIEPGIYDIGTSSLQMKDYVDIQGSGEKVTKITGTIDSSLSGVLEGEDNAEVRFLTVENTGGGDDAIAIYNAGVSPKITHVTATASGGTYGYGVANFSSSSPTMTNVTVIASGVTSCFGVYNDDSSSPTMTNLTATVSGAKYNHGVYNYYYSSPKMTNVTAKASGGTANYGVYNNDCSSPAMTNMTAEASGGTNNNGVRNNDSCYPTMTNVTAIASGGASSNYGVRNTSSSGVTIDHSVLSGDNVALQNDSTGVTTYIGSTRLSGEVSAGNWTKCAGVYDGDFTFYADTCP